MAYPKIPKGPVSLTINGMIVDAVLHNFARTYLSPYDYEVTSGYRNRIENIEADGTQFSAHLYNLARDIVLKDKSTGQYLTPDRLKEVYQIYVKPYWQGWSNYNPPATGTTGWIHLNLDRDISKSTILLDYAANGFILAIGIKKLLKKINYGKGQSDA